jgi:hypothetical protein
MRFAELDVVCGASGGISSILKCTDHAAEPIGSRRLRWSPQPCASFRRAFDLADVHRRRRTASTRKRCTPGSNERFDQVACTIEGVIYIISASAGGSKRT